MSQQTGYRNNNWLNVRFNPNNNWVGQTGADDGGYAQFENPIYGLRAADKVLENYGARHKINTIRGAISRFAPPGDNNPTENYINFVAREAGISSDAEIDLQDPGIRERLISAMVRFETPDAAKEYNSKLLEQARTLSGQQNQPKTSDPDTGIQLFLNSQKKPAAKPLAEKLAEVDDPYAYEVTDPIQIFKRGMSAGGENLGANLNYFRGIAASIVGDEEAKEDAILSAKRGQLAASEILAPVESFEEFLEEPTFGGFVNQVFSATGQFIPSAAASITTAMVGAAVGAVAGLTAPVTGTAIAGTLAAGAAKKKLVKDSVNKYMANEAARRQGKKNLPYTLTKDEQNVIDGAFGILQREYRKQKVASATKLGAVAGAVTQEFPQGAGTAFGIFAEQGMTDPLQAFQSLGIGVPFTAVGVGGEALVARGLFNMARKTGGPVNNSLARDILVSGALKTGAVEGATEALQEELSIQQRFAIDEDYKQSQAKLDRAQALFSGFFGGVGIGGIGSTIASGVRVAQDPSQAIFNKARGLVKEQFEREVDQQIDLEQALAEGQPFDGVYPEPSRWIQSQISALSDPSTKKDSVWVDENSREEFFNLPESVLDIENAQVVDAPGVGVLITTNPTKANDFKNLVTSDIFNTTKLDSFLANSLDYAHGRKPGDNLVVEVRDSNNNLAWYQQTNEQDLDAVYVKAGSVFPGEGYNISHQEMKSHLRERSEILGPKTASIDIDEDTLSELGFATETSEQELATIDSFSEAEPQPVTEGQVGSPESPILNNNQQPWKGLTSLDVFKDEKNLQDYNNLKEEVLGLLTGFEVQTEFKNLIEQDAFSEGFLNAFKKLQEQDNLNIYAPTQVGRAEDGTPTYGFLKYQFPTTGMAEAPAREVQRWVTEAKKREKSVVKFQNKEQDWTVLSPERANLNKEPEPINMPRLTNFGREWNNRTQAQGTMAQGAEETALLGYSTAVSSLLLNNYQLFWNGKPLSELTREDEQKAIVYTSGNTSYTAADLAGSREFEGTPQQLGGESRARTLSEREQDIQNLFEQEIQLEETISRLESSLDEDPNPETRLELEIQLTEAQKTLNNIRFGISRESSSAREALQEEALQRQVDDRSRLPAIGRTPEFDPDDFGPQVEGTQEQGAGGETGAQVEVPLDQSPEQIRQREIALNLVRRINSNKARLRALGREAAVEKNTPEAKELSKKIQEDIAILTRVNKNINQLTRTVVLNSTDIPGIRADIERGVGKGRKFSDTFNPLFNPKDERTEAFKQKFSKTVSDRIGDVGFLNSVISTIKNDFKLKRDIEIIAADEAFGISRIRNQKIVNDVKNEQQVVLGQKPDANGQTKALAGRILKYYDRDIIILNLPENATQEQQGLAMIALSHELGHSVFEQELARSLDPRGNTYAKLEAAFSAVRSNTDVAQYQDDNFHAAFEEWFADQTAIYLLDSTREAKNGVESIFKRIANKLRAVFNKFKQLTKRFTPNAAFNDYVRATVADYKNKTFNTRKIPLSHQGQAIIKSMVEDDIPKAAKEVGKKKVFFDIAKEAENILEGDPDKFSNFAKRILVPADNLLRGLGPEGVTLANIFLKQSQAEGEIGFLAAKLQKVNEYINKIEKAAGITDRVTPESTAILLEAENNLLNDSELSPQAREVRKIFSDLYEAEKLGATIDVAKLPNFFPRVVALRNLENSAKIQSELVDAIVEFNKNNTFKDEQGNEFTYDEKAARLLVDLLAADPDRTTIDISEQSPNQAFAIGLSKERSRAFASIPTSALRGILSEEGDSLLEDPEVAVRKYIQNIVKKNELEKRGGAKEITRLIKALPAEKRQHAVDAVLAILGKVNPEMGSVLKNVNNVGVTLNVLTLLSFAVFASAPDLAGPILRSKEFSKANFSNFAKEISNYFKNKEEAAQFAKELGVITSDAISTMYVNAGELDFLDPKAKKVNEVFFKGIGLDWFTRFTRIVAAGMGRKFLIDHGQRAKAGEERSVRYLKELGNLTWQDVAEWQKNNQSFDSPVGQKIKLGLFQFVDESIVRPNAAERPIWASDPRFALIWQLKSFFYAYGKNIIGGLIRESKNRYNEEGFPAASLPFLLGAITLLPLTMLGLDLRERFKVGLAWVLPGVSPEDKNYRRSVDMDWGEYSFEIIDRSGVLGPFALAMPLFMESKRYGDPFWTGPLGPTVERAYDLGSGDFKFDSILPLYNQL